MDRLTEMKELLGKAFDKAKKDVMAMKDELTRPKTQDDIREEDAGL